MLSQHFSCIVVPATPAPNVCAVYDEVNGALQIIESTWNEVVYTHITNPLIHHIHTYTCCCFLTSIQDSLNVSADCVNGLAIRASYELSYTSSSGASITTCVVDETDCSNGVCRHELQNNIRDSRCQPPVSQFNSESVTVTVTAGNIVGRSSPAVSRSISEL